MQNEATKKFVRIGDGKCKMRVQWRSRVRVNRANSQGIIWYVRPEKITYVAKGTKDNSVSYTFDFSSGAESRPGFIEAIECSNVSSEYDKYVTEVILEEKPSQ